ncbi:KxYKxGKxW signal peptide domain-containing protein [Alkalihalobacterium elongatum]
MKKAKRKITFRKVIFWRRFKLYKSKNFLLYLKILFVI